MRRRPVHGWSGSARGRTLQNRVWEAERARAPRTTRSGRMRDHGPCNTSVTSGLVQGPADECRRSAGPAEGLEPRKAPRAGPSGTRRGVSAQSKSAHPALFCRRLVAVRRSRHASREQAVRCEVSADPTQSLAASWTRAQAGSGGARRRAAAGPRAHHLRLERCDRDDGVLTRGDRRSASPPRGRPSRRAAADRRRRPPSLPWASFMRTASGVGGWSSRTISGWAYRRRAGSAPRTCMRDDGQPVAVTSRGTRGDGAEEARGEETGRVRQCGRVLVRSPVRCLPCTVRPGGDRRPSPEPGRQVPSRSGDQRAVSLVRIRVSAGPVGCERGRSGRTRTTGRPSLAARPPCTHGSLHGARSARAYIAAARWRFAKTMPQWPHRVHGARVKRPDLEAGLPRVRGTDPRRRRAQAVASGRGRIPATTTPTSSSTAGSTGRWERRCPRPP